MYWNSPVRLHGALDATFELVPSPDCKSQIGCKLPAQTNGMHEKGIITKIKIFCKKGII
jgi:hypothetical protein